MAERKPIRMLRGEKWKVLKGHISEGPIKYKYALSDYGRIVKFNKHLTDGFLLKLSRQEGFPIWRKRMKGKYFAALIHRLVGKYFLPKSSEKQKFIIHLDYDKENNYYKNLKWAKQEEVTSHARYNPSVIRAKENMRNNIRSGSGYNTKLTLAKVNQIKAFLNKGKTLRELSQKYSVSDMQIHRIKTGENWSYIK